LSRAIPFQWHSPYRANGDGTPFFGRRWRAGYTSAIGNVMALQETFLQAGRTRRPVSPFPHFVRRLLPHPSHATILVHTLESWWATVAAQRWEDREGRGGGLPLPRAGENRLVRRHLVSGRSSVGKGRILGAAIGGGDDRGGNSLTPMRCGKGVERRRCGWIARLANGILLFSFHLLPHRHRRVPNRHERCVDGILPFGVRRPHTRTSLPFHVVSVYVVYSFVSFFVVHDGVSISGRGKRTRALLQGTTFASLPFSPRNAIRACRKWFRILQREIFL